jgi:hypothetical protein
MRALYAHRNAQTALSDHEAGTFASTHAQPGTLTWAIPKVMKGALSGYSTIEDSASWHAAQRPNTSTE